MPISRRSFAKAVSVAGLTAAFGARFSEAQQKGSVFQHGVASGDPLINRVILWTRITPPAPEDPLPVEWSIAEDPAMAQVVQNGVTYTNIAFDYTVKVDVGRLDPNKTYYYRFGYRGSQSPVGRTKTLPAGNVDQLRFAVVSCSNYPYGFFNAYGNIAARADLDCVLHLGDYIYEYANGQYGDGTSIGRIPTPDKELLLLDDYRQRYAQYRSDPDLQEAHRQHPWITVWDDHETANDGWVGGAENHTPATEGDWYQRRAVAAQAYFEWMPIRENPFLDSNIYRTFKFGNLVDLVMLDTRYAGRSRQVGPTNPALLDPSRTLLGGVQEAWLHNELIASSARGTQWRLIGQQVMMGQLLNPDATPFNTDQWDGYPVSRARFLNDLAMNSISNVAVLTGDIHSSWGNEIAANPFLSGGYVAQAAEFVTPAVTSPGIDDRAQATLLQAQILATHPHVKYVELFRRGYLLLDIDRNRTQGEWYHVRTITERTRDEELARVLAVASGENRLLHASASAPGRSVPLAP